MRHAPLLVLVVLQLQLQGASGETEADAKRNCSKALGFNDTAGAKDRSRQDLRFCTEHHERTCCESSHEREVLARYAAFSHDASGRCGQLSRLALCALCDGDVGEGLKAERNQIVLCPSFCRRWFQSCRQDYFAPDSSGSRLTACRPDSLVCSPLDEITQESRSFCNSISPYVVADDEDLDICYDGVPAARSRGSGPKAPYARPPRRRTTPFWRHMWPPVPFSQWPKASEVMADLAAIELQVPRRVQGYEPGIAVGLLCVIFAWYIWRAVD